ncbi:MAG TPA: ATP-binding protein [Acidimicrobiales bacterium]|nr:ATP-binding protein [Acidimicrobiales bacterium]
MVEVSTSTLIAVAGVTGAVLLLLLVLLLLSHRGAHPDARRVASVVARLEGPDPGGAGHGDEHDTVSRLERLAEGAVLRASDARDAVNRLKAGIDALGDGVVVCDEVGHVVYRNPAADEFGEDDGMVREAVDDIMASGTAGQRCSRVLELLGPPRRSLSVTGRPIDDGRRLIGAAVTITDVSERRRLDIVRRDFVTNLTSELKTPVAALGLLAGTIVREDEPALTRRLAERLGRDSLRVGRMIDDLVELSRLDAQVLPVREPVPVHLLVAQAVEEIRSMAIHRSISIDTAEAPHTLTVVGDRRQLVSGLRHLVENAVRFSEDGSQVQVKARLDDGTVELCVTDRGPGIPPRELDRIFECFYRVDAGRGRNSAGIGIGLAIASQVAAGHGGDVRVDSKEGEGSTFTLRIPAGPGARSAPIREAG